jgi:hypothetical protein
VQSRQHSGAFGLGGNLLVHLRFAPEAIEAGSVHQQIAKVQSRGLVRRHSLKGSALMPVMTNLVTRAARASSTLGARLLLGGYIAFSALNAQAADSAAKPDNDVKAAFGNTVVSTYQDGRSQKIWLHPDGAWTGLSRRGNDLAGTYTVKGQKVCFKQKKPPTLPVAFCSDFPDNPKIGATWSSKDMTGAPIQVSLVKGVVSKAPATR